MSIFERLTELFGSKPPLMSGTAKMDKTVERTLAKKIIRSVAATMKPYGYALTMPTFLCREGPLVVSFFHFHKYRSRPAFRIHFGVRVLNDDFDAAALNGPQFSDPHKYAYEAGEADVERCVAAITALLVSKGLPWHASWSDVCRLISDGGDPMSELKRSPLSDSERQRLAEAENGQSSAENVALSRLLLGIKPINSAHP